MPSRSASPSPNERAVPPLRDSKKIFIAGASGSGKSYTAREQYLRHFPRRIYVDFIGEYDQDVEVTVYSVQELDTYVRDHWNRGRWSVAIVPDDDLDGLVEWAVPLPQLEERSVTRAAGGVAMLFDEVDTYAGPGASRRLPIRTLWRRARHAALTIVATTQRPANVSKEVTSQSNHVLCLQLTEWDDIDYMERAIGCRLRGDPFDAWLAAHPNPNGSGGSIGGLWHNRRTRETRWYDGTRFLAPTQVPGRPARPVPGQEEPEAPGAERPGPSVPASGGRPEPPSDDGPSRDPGDDSA